MNMKKRTYNRVEQGDRYLRRRSPFTPLPKKSGQAVCTPATRLPFDKMSSGTFHLVHIYGGS
jgi:hypothetical protein